MKKVFVLASALISMSAWAQMLVDQGPPQHRVVYRNTLSLRLNPLGATLESRIMYRYRLFASDSPALRDNFIGVGAAAAFNPAFVNIGPYVEFQPLSILGFWATYQYSRYFRTFGLFQSFQSASSDFSDTEIARRRDLPVDDPLKNYVASGGELMIGADFQVKFWNIMLRSRTRLVRADYAMRDGDTVFYEQYYDVLAPNHGWYVTDDVDLAYQTPDNKLFVGARYTITNAFYTGRNYLAGEEQVNPNLMQRVGPFAGYTFKIEDGARFNNPTVFLLVQWWLQHRFRTGAVSSQAYPLLGIGFQFTGDLLPFDKNKK